jgi:hypothetical protein
MTVRAWWLAVGLIAFLSCDGSSGTGRVADASASEAPSRDLSAVDRPTPDTSALPPDVAPGIDGPLDQATVDLPPEAPAGPRPPALTWVKEGPTFIGDVIRGTAADDIWVVNKAGSAWHSRGDGMWQYRSPGTWQLTGVWGSGPNDVYVSVLANFVFHWDGMEWKKQTDGIPIGTTYRTVWGTGAGDVFVAGGSVYRSAGDGRWAGLPHRAGVGPFADIWGSGPSDVWVLGEGGIARWRGERGWQYEPKPGVRGAVGIWGSGPNDVYVLYFDAVYHTDGNGTWTTQSVPEKQGDNEDFKAIWGSGPTDVYIGGGEGRVFHSKGDGRWFAEPIDPALPRLNISSIWGTGPNNVYLATPGGVYRGR